MSAIWPIFINIVNVTLYVFEILKKNTFQAAYRIKCFLI